jgi:hypothetical protein
MKWIGQYIYDLISRFRSDVYLEDISTGTIASGGNLGLDSNNKIVKATETTGDITSVSLISDSGTINGLTGAVNFTIEGGAGIDTSATGSTLTITGALGEREYAYTYITWSASAKPARDGSNNPEWMVPNTSKGIYEEDWNLDTNITSTTTGTTTYAFSRYSTVNSLIIPHAGILVGFHAIGRNDDSDLTFKAGLFHADNGSGSAGADGSAAEGIDYGSTDATNEYTLRCVATAVETEASGGTDGTTGHNFKGPCKLISNTANLTVQAGDALMPAIMGNSSNSTDEIFVTMTIILKIPLTT